MKEAVNMRDEAAENKAREIIQKYGFDQMVPVDLLKIALDNGIEVKNAEFKNSDIAGILYKKNGKTIIFVSSSDPDNRKRFTVAHELGHYFLHPSTEDVLQVEYRTNGKNGDPQKEKEANCFAAALLMDEVLVKSLWNDLKSVQSLAEIFKVSFAAMSYRLNNLELL